MACEDSKKGRCRHPPRWQADACPLHARACGLDRRGGLPVPSPFSIGRAICVMAPGPWHWAASPLLPALQHLPAWYFHGIALPGHIAQFTQWVCLLSAKWGPTSAALFSATTAAWGGLAKGRVPGAQSACRRAGKVTPSACGDWKKYVMPSPGRQVSGPGRLACANFYI